MINLAALPEGWLDAIAKNSPHSASNTSNDRKDGFLAPGHRNADLASFAGYMKRKHNMNESDLLHYLSALNIQSPTPLRAHEVESIARSISKYGASPPDMDEARLSKELAIFLKPGFRYVINIGWMHYSETHWIRDPEDKNVQEATKRFVEANHQSVKAWAEKASGTDYNAAKRIISASQALLGLRKIRNLMELASSDPNLLYQPSHLDSRSMLLNVSNGTLELTSGGVKFRPHDPDDLISKCATVIYDPEAGSPNFDSMMQDILSDEDRAFVLRFFGYVLTAEADQQCFAIFYGAGANGKSTLTNIIHRILGDYSVGVEPSSFIKQKGNGTRNDIARLDGARLALTSELGPGEQLDAPMLKRFVGGDPLTARFLFHEFFTFKPIAIPVFVTNALPIINGADKALCRRIILIEFSNIIPPEARNFRLPELLWEERSGILNHLLRGAVDYLSTRDLQQPDSVIEKTKAYVQKSDLMGLFLEDCCESGADLSCKSSDLIDAYRHWCISQSIKSLSAPQFKSELEKRKFTCKKTKIGNVWQGLSLAAQQPW